MHQLPERAKAAGFSALVVTLDTRCSVAARPTSTAAYLPFLRLQGLANYLGDPAFLAGLAKPPDEDPASAVLRWLPMFPDPGLSWRDLPFLREHWDGPIVLKGI